MPNPQLSLTLNHGSFIKLVFIKIVKYKRKKKTYQKKIKLKNSQAECKSIVLKIDRQSKLFNQKTYNKTTNIKW